MCFSIIFTFLKGLGGLEGFKKLCGTRAIHFQPWIPHIVNSRSILTRFCLFLVSRLSSMKGRRRRILDFWLGAPPVGRDKIEVIKSLSRQFSHGPHRSPHVAGGLSQESNASRNLVPSEQRDRISYETQQTATGCLGQPEASQEYFCYPVPSSTQVPFSMCGDKVVDWGLVGIIWSTKPSIR